MGTMGSSAANGKVWKKTLVCVQMKEQAYRTAAAGYGWLLNETSEGHSLLHIFTALTVHGKGPEESIAREVFGA